jgi:hypothetical protein
VDWKLPTDHLRCNPSFHGHERRDCARTFQTLFMFKHTVGSSILDLALVLPLDAPLGPQRVVDRDLRLTRLRARPMASSEFIPLQSIIRGALLVPDFDSDRDYFVVNYVDTDMFLRSQRQLF